MLYSMYVKWRIAAIAAVLVFLTLPVMDVLPRILLSLGFGLIPLWVLPSGGAEPGDEFTWARTFLGLPMLFMYSVLGAFVWWNDAVWWSNLIAVGVLIMGIVLSVALKFFANRMDDADNTFL